MIVKLKATMSDGVTVVNEIMRENIYQNQNLLTYDYPTPDLSEPASDLLDAIDKFNYGLLSKTEFTEYLYRFHGNAAKVWITNLSEFGEAFIKDGPYGVIEFIF